MNMKQNLTPTRHTWHVWLGSALALLFLVAACERSANPPLEPTLEVEAFSASPRAVAVGERVTFSWRVNTPAGARLRCLLDGDGDGEADYILTACAQKRQTHRYAAPGSYTAKLTVVDAEGQETSSFVRGIQVAPQPGPEEPELVWEGAPSQPYKVAEAQGVALGGKLYVFGGFDSTERCCTPTARAHVYDPEAETWTPIQDLPEMNGTGHGGVTHAGFTTDGTDIFFAGGYTSNGSGTGQIFGTEEVWRYEVAEDRYTRLPDLPVPRAAGQLEYVGGKLHYFGGTNKARTRDTGEHFVLDLQGGATTWTEAAPLPNPRNHLGSAVLGGKIYAIGGQHNHDHKLTTQDDVHVYDPRSDTWTERASLPAAVSHISNSTFVMAGVMDGRILVVGGEHAHLKPVSSVYAYDPQTGAWTSLTDLPRALQSAVSKVVDGDILVTGGSSSGWRAESYRGWMR